MVRIAFSILLQDKPNYLALVLGIALATLLISQQAATFDSVMYSTVRDIAEVGQVDIWVMNTGVESLEKGTPMATTATNRVKAVDGVDWAVPYFQTIAQLKPNDGTLRSVQLAGIDEGTLIGGPRKMLIGRVEDLRQPDGVIIDYAGFDTIFPHETPRIGVVFEIGVKRAKVVGICKSPGSWNGLPRIFALHSTAVAMAGDPSHSVTFVLAKSKTGDDPKRTANKISDEIGLKARTKSDFMRETRIWVLKSSGIAENFALTITIGVVIGIAIVGQTFYLFSTQNLKHFATIKAIGVQNGDILKLMLINAVFVASLGYGVGIGTSNIYFVYYGTKLTGTLRGIFMDPTVFIGSGVFILLITIVSCLLSIKKVLVVDTAIVFKEST